ncbi:MAG: amino acid ABC transporter ATP-binding protein [Clostridiales bacterium]|nr:amino acid ABC transporter ATP-binding protein [Clostridiales bacterium]
MVLSVDNVSKSFKDNVVLDNINFKVNKGEVVSIFGKSGAGKSTLLRCINGLETIDKGNILVDGEYLYREADGKVEAANGDRIKKIRRSLGYVFQNFNLFPNLNVMENLILSPTKVYNLTKDEAEKKAFELLTKLNIEDKANYYPYELSGGQKQRVAIARACMLTPKIICFDEPTSAVDDEVKRSIYDIIKAFKSENVAVILVSHDRDFVESISDRIINLECGKII